MAKSKLAPSVEKIPIKTKAYLITWVGVICFMASLLVMLISKAVLMAKAKCKKKASSESSDKEMTTMPAKKHQTKNPILLSSLTLALFGTYFIFMDQIGLTQASFSSDNNIPCLIQFGGEKEYITTCNLESEMLERLAKS